MYNQQLGWSETQQNSSRKGEAESNSKWLQFLHLLAVLFFPAKESSRRSFWIKCFGLKGSFSSEKLSPSLGQRAQKSCTSCLGRGRVRQP